MLTDMRGLRFLREVGFARGSDSELEWRGDDYISDDYDDEGFERLDINPKGSFTPGDLAELLEDLESSDLENAVTAMKELQYATACDDDDVIDSYLFQHADAFIKALARPCFIDATLGDKSEESPLGEVAISILIGGGFGTPFPKQPGSSGGAPSGKQLLQALRPRALHVVRYWLAGERDSGAPPSSEAWPAAEQSGCALSRTSSQPLSRTTRSRWTCSCGAFFTSLRRSCCPCEPTASALLCRCEGFTGRIKHACCGVCPSAHQPCIQYCMLHAHLLPSA